MRFHRLKLTESRRVAEDAAVLRFDVPGELSDAFAFVPGQYVNLRLPEVGQAATRAYSLCALPDRAGLSIGVRRLSGGVVSGRLLDLAPGAEIDLSPPNGRFGAPALKAERLLVFAAGSGITPILPILQSVLAEPSATAVLVYANRTPDSAMFLDDLREMQRASAGRLDLKEIYSRQPSSGDLPQQLHHAGVRAMLADLDLSRIDHVLLCGPDGMIDACRDCLAEAGVARDRVHFERFGATATAPDQPAPAPTAGEATTLSIDLDGDTHVIPAAPGQTLLEAMLEADLDAPYSCMAGSCLTCRCHVAGGVAEMAVNEVLTEAEIAEGYVLACQARPVNSPALSVTF